MSWKLKEKLSARLSREKGAVVKERGGKTSVALVYPNEYAIGMGNLAVHSIYRALNDMGGVVCERFFLPDGNDIEEYRQSNVDLMSLETRTPLCEFDVVAFTISFENDYLNILPILALGKIPHKMDDRRSDHPLVIAGGAAPSINPNPIAEIFDAILIGEYEEFHEEIVKLLTSGLSKKEMLAELDLVNGVRSSSHESRVTSHEKRTLTKLDEWKTQTIIYNDEVEFGNMHLIEVQRGCPRKCKFCATPSLYYPPRRRSADAIIRMVDDGIAMRNKFGLIGADLLSHPEFVEIATAIHARDATFSPSSIRVDAIDEIKAKLLATSKHKSLALGIEAGTEKLRQTLRKKLTDDKILNAVALLAKHGMTRIRLYFMLGLPGENTKDVDAIAALSKRVVETIRRNAPKGEGFHNAEMTISPFIPKPGTPFENEEFVGEKYLKENLGHLKKCLLGERGLSIHFDSALSAMLENFLSNARVSALPFFEEIAEGKKIKQALKSYFQ